MSLAGRLDSFPLPEVLHLLARSDKSGCLEVKNSDVEGSLYLIGGKLAYGTTKRQDDTGEQAIAAGLVSERAWVEVERGEKTMLQVLSDSKTEDDLQGFIQELVVNTVFRLSRDQDGQFEFRDDVAPPYGTGREIDIDQVLAETRVRVEEWGDIEAAIPGVGFRLRMAINLSKREVTITAEAWRALAALDGVGSITEVAQTLGSSEFQAGRVLADLVREGLVEIVDQTRTSTAQYYYGDHQHTPEVAPVEQPTAETELSESEDETVEPALFRRRRGIGALKLEEE